MYIYGCIGLPGSGKTLFLTILGYKAFWAKHKIMSNYKLAFPHERLNLEKLSKFKISNVLLLLDEAYNLVDSRRSTSLVNRLASYLVFQVRKRNISIAYSCQYFMSVDIRLRNLTTHKIFCSKEKDGFYYTVDYFGSVKEFFLPFERARPFFKLFNTNEYYDIIESVKFVENLKKAVKEEVSARE